MKRVRTKSSDNYGSNEKAKKDKRISPKRKGSLAIDTGSADPLSPLEDMKSPIERALSPITKTLSPVEPKVNNNTSRATKPKFSVKVVSYGRQHGPMADPDIETEECLKFSVRDVPNPSAKLRKNYTGLSARLRKEIFSDKAARLRYDTMVIEVEKMMNAMEVAAKWDSAHPGAVDEDAPTVLIVGVQCEEGKHRSVAFVEELASSIKRDSWSVAVVHRDLDVAEADGLASDGEDDEDSPTMGKKTGIKAARKKDKEMRKARKGGRIQMELGGVEE